MTTTDALGLADKERFLFEEADKAYFKAGETSDPQDWLQASLLARQHRNALTALRAVLEAPAVSTGEVAEMLALADEYEAGLAKLIASGYEEYGPTVQHKHRLTINALRSAASLPAAKAAGNDRTCAENAQVASGDVRAAVIEFEYTNWEGRKSLREARPISIRFGKSEWHPQPQWLMCAFDIDKGEEREFAMIDMQFEDSSLGTIALSQAPATDAAAVARGEEPDNCSCSPRYRADCAYMKGGYCVEPVAPTPAPNGAGREALEKARSEIAAYLLARDEDYAVTPHMMEWARTLITAGLSRVHSGDCTKESHACNRCIAERALEDADAILALASSPVVGRTEWQPIDQEPDEWQWRACIGGRWGSWLHLDQPIGYFKGRNAFNLDNGTYELRPLYARPTPPSETKDCAGARPERGGPNAD